MGEIRKLGGVGPTPGRRSTRGTVTILPRPEPRPVFCPLISADDHVLEPPSLFEGRLPRALADRAPRVVFDDDGIPSWLIEGEPTRVLAANGLVGRPVREWSPAPAKFDDFLPGVADPKERLLDMDICGVWASLNFPSMVWGFAGSRYSLMKDEELGLACVRAYNDWVIDEWCATDADRFIPCQITWLRDPAIAAAEIRRNAKRGFKAVSFSENPEGQGMPSIHTGTWDPFFAACEETETVINLHVGSQGSVTVGATDSPVEVVVALFPVSGMIALADWMFSRVPLRFPGLRIALSEGGASWVPTLAERFGRAYRQAESSTYWTAKDPDPVEVMRRNFSFTSIEDPSAFTHLDTIGVDNLMLEVDYPHADSTWPDTQRLARGELKGLPADVVKSICFGNAARLYRHPEPPADRLASSEVGRTGSEAF
jgi:predicted TIM-barrel fold metal-dependent hydrolase